MGKHVEGTSFNLTDTSLAGEGTGTPASDLDLLSGNIDVEHSELPCQMKQTAASAMDELIKLLQTDEPLWIKSSVDDQYFLHGESYNKINPRSSVSKCLHSRIESSKDSAVVLMGGSLLVDMFLDSDKWMDLFPTIVSKAQTIHVFQSGLLENQSGSLQLIYEQTQSLVPLIPPQEFYVIRYCQQIETDVWAVVDVSCDDLQDGSGVTPTCSWKRPSGCMIQAMPNGLSKVTWVEHIEVDDSIQINENCKGLVSSGLAFGAKRWVLSLQRICERYAYLNVASTPCHGLPEVRIMPEGRRSMAMLAYRMVKSFCSIYSTCGLEDLPRSLEMIGNGVQVAIRKNTNPGQPTGLVISAISCIWLPAPPHEVFSYLNDHTMRSQWDILCNRSPIREIVHIPTGNHPANCISVLQPNNQAEDLLIFQETLLDSLGSLLVYAPIDVSTISSVSTGADSSAIPILASGFAISSDGSPDQTNVASTSSSSSMPGGSFLTAAFQVLAYSSLYADDVDMEFVSTVNDFVWSTVQKIKSAIEISGILVKGIYEVWGEGSCYEELEEAVKRYPEEKKSPYLAPGSTFKINIDSFGKVFSTEEQKERMAKLAFIPFEGRVNLRNPDHKFWLIEINDHGINNGLPPIVQRRIFFGREVGAADRKLIPTYQLKSRAYIGPTSMDAEMAFLMANQGLAAPGKLVFDPFVGTGSVLVAAARFGAMTMGADIDIRVVRDGRGPDRDVWSNFKQYGLPEPISLLRADNNLPPWRAGLKEVFDAIICDPPYGVRAGGRKSGGRKLLKGAVDPYTVPEDKRADHIPSTAPYSLAECVHDLLDLAARMLVMGGRLVFFFPVLRDEGLPEPSFPKHPCFKLVAVCEQILSYRYSRVLLTMVKTTAYSEEIAEAAKMMHLEFKANHLKWLEEGNLHSAVFASVNHQQGEGGESKVSKDLKPKYRGKYV